MAPNDTLQAVRVLARLTRVIERACQDSQLSLPQYRLLLYISRTSQRAGELASKAAVSRPTLTSLVDGLERQGLVERSRVSGDRRGINLVLTDDGKKAIDETERMLAERVAALTDDADADVVGALVALGAVMDRNLEAALERQAATASDNTGDSDDDGAAKAAASKRA